MKNIILKSPSIISFICLLAIAFFMPLTDKPLGILIGIFALFSVFDGFLNKSFKIYNWPIFILIILFFFIHLVSVAWSDNQNRAWFDVEVKLSLLIFPIAFVAQNPFLRRHLKYILYSFVLGAIVSSLLMLTIAYFNYQDIGSIAFYYTNISLFHPSYMAMYFIMAIAIIIKFMVNKKRSVAFITTSSFGILILLRMIFLLQSKAGMLTIIAISIFLLIISVIKLRSLLLKIAITLLVASFSLIMVQKSSRLQAMISSVEEISESGSSDDSTTGVRFEIWKIAWNQIQNNWLIGVGAGDIKPVIFEDYEKHNIEVAMRKNLNIHNQYLETFLGQGIIGIALLLALFYFGFKEAAQRKDWMLSVFLLIIAISFAPESMLNTQAGVVFFAFFFNFLFLLKDETKEERPTT